MSPKADKLVDDYLKRLDAELVGLPRARRREVVEEISQHIAEARADLATQEEAEIRNLMERVGDPAEIAAEARERFGIQPRTAGFLEIAALVLLLVGGFLVIGWFVGLVLLWASNVWTTRDKLIGTFVVPGGLALPLGLFFLAGTSVESCSGELGPQGKVLSQTCSGGWSLGAQVLAVVVFGLLLIAPFATTVYLSRRMRKEQPAPVPA
jgi:HAAS domain-containing protein